MARDLDKLILGMLVGAGLGYLSTRLLDAERKRKRIETAARRPPRRLPEQWSERKAERVGRTLMTRVERMRTAGH